MTKDINSLISGFEKFTDLSNGVLVIPPKNKEEVKITKRGYERVSKET